MKVGDINLVLNKFKRMSTDNIEYTFYYDLILKHYEKLIWKLVIQKSPVQIKEDVFNECVLKIPGLVKKWKPQELEFSAYLFMSLRGVIQRSVENMKVVPHPAAKLKFKNKNKNVPIISFTQADDYVNECFAFPPTFQTIEQDLDFETYRNEILKLENGKIWLDHYVDGMKLKELEDKYGIKKQQITIRLKKIHPIIVKRIKRIIGDE